jgi:hypothetical protein
MTKHIKLRLQRSNVLKTYTLAGFEPGIFCSACGRDDHYATPRVWNSRNFYVKNIEDIHLGLGRTERNPFFGFGRILLTD